MLGSKYLKGWSRTMPVLALSTGESELAAVTKGISEALGAQAVLQDFGHRVSIQILSDATAAIGICRRQGLGRIRHLATSDLWCQQVVRDKVVSLAKWPGKENPADMFTKYLPRHEIVAHLARLGIGTLPGRSTIAPIRDGTVPCETPTTFDPETDLEKSTMLVEMIPAQSAGRNSETISIDCIETELNQELVSNEGHDGLGGCRNPTLDSNTACYDSAFAWYDMVNPEMEDPGREIPK